MQTLKIFITNGDRQVIPCPMGVIIKQKRDVNISLAVPDDESSTEEREDKPFSVTSIHPIHLSLIHI